MKSVSRKLLQAIRPARLGNRVPLLAEVSDTTRPFRDARDCREFLARHPLADARDKKGANPSASRSGGATRSERSSADSAELGDKVVQLRARCARP